MNNGVPQLLAGFGNVVSNVTVLAADAVSLLGLNPHPWGVYLDGSAVVEADSVVAFEYRQDYKIVDYPVEQGAFESYNKVQSPFTVRVTLTRGGNAQKRRQFMDDLDACISSLELFDVVTPEKTYLNVNAEHVEYRRTADSGISLITAELWLREVRVVGATANNNTAAPDGQPSFFLGTISPAAVVQSVSSTASAAVASVTSGASSLYSKLGSIF